METGSRDQAASMYVNRVQSSQMVPSYAVLSQRYINHLGKLKKKKLP